jgi:leader peptidase (prepilin peptidase)/N-methyltransferase
VSHGRWMGFGDVKLAFLIGVFLNYPLILVGLFSAFLLGAIIGLGFVIFDKKKFKNQIPFGPFLATGTFVAFFWGEKIINWYLNLL